MTARDYLKLYLVTLSVFVTVDLCWLGLAAADFYRRQLGHLLAPEVSWPAALVFYGTYCVGIVAFAVLPGLRARSLARSVGAAAGFGFFTYTTYHLTNMATLPHWPWRLVLVDTGWGMALCALAAAAGYRAGIRRSVRPGLRAGGT